VVVVVARTEKKKQKTMAADLPADVAAYGDPAYWDARFETEDAHEWCGDWAALAGAVLPHLAGARRILVLGAGTSSLPFDLAASEGLRHLEEVVATDISPTAVAKLAGRAERMASTATSTTSTTTPARVTAAVADMLALPFPESAFDAVIEKGTLDCLEVAGADGGAPDRWDPPPCVRGRMHAALGEAHRVLKKDGGIFLSVTWAPPHFRRGHYYDDPRYDWGGPDAVVAAVGGSVPVVLYALRRGDREKCAQWRRRPPAELTRRRGEGDEGGEEGLPVAPSHEHMDREDFLLGIGGGGGSSEDEDG
jgi:SAM-dependent methyltransferase